MEDSPIYLDNHASTMVDPRVFDEMAPWFARCGNPSSRSHRHGWEAEEAVEEARARVAALVGAKSSEIVFTAGATESNNTILKGLWRRVVTTAVEHKSVLATCAWMATSRDMVPILVPVDHDGRVDPRNVFKAVHCGDMVSVMLANNEVGTIQPVGEIAALLDCHGLPLHSDIAQAVGKIPVDLPALGVHFASFSAHKMYGPKGVGAMYMREDRAHLLSPLIHGGGQEHGMRSGTLNVPAIVGFGKACEIAAAELATEGARIGAMRDRLETLLLQAFPDAVVHGSNRLPGNLHISLPCGDINAFMAYVSDTVSLSLGSACTSNAGKSHVLEAMRLDEDEARRAVRMCVGRFNTDEEITKAAEEIVRALDMANNGG